MSTSSVKALQVHDATLRSVFLDFPAGTLTATLAPVGAPEFTLIFSGVTNVHAPREQPWGPSASVNEFRQPSITRYEIEMQSGDVLTIEAAAFNTSGGSLLREAP